MTHTNVRVRMTVPHFQALTNERLLFECVCVHRAGLIRRRLEIIFSAKMYFWANGVPYFVREVGTGDVGGGGKYSLR